MCQYYAIFQYVVIIAIHINLYQCTSQHLSQTTPSSSTYLKQTSNRLYILFDNLDITLIKSALSVYVLCLFLCGGGL